MYDSSLAQPAAVKPVLRRRMVNGGERAQLAASLGFEPGEFKTVYCAYCGVEGRGKWHWRENSRVGWFSTSLEIDHIIPLCQGGTYDPDNLTLACRRCNRSKGGR